MILRHVCRRQARALFGSSPRHSFFQTRSLADEAGITTATETPQPIPQPVHSVPSVQETLDLQAKSDESQGQATVREQWGNFNLRRRQFNRLGSAIERKYQPEDLIKNPPGPSDVTLELLLAAQSHLGHATSLWNPANSGYIYGIRQGVHIISLEVTAAYLRRAAKVVEEVARRGGLILFVGTRKGQKRTVIRAAELAGGYYIFERWVPGTLTNAEQVLEGCPVKVVDKMDNTMHGETQELPEISALKPDLVVCLNPLENLPLLHECGHSTVPTIGIIDTDTDPTRVTYPIPANDDSLRCAGVIAGVLARAGEAGQKTRLEQSRNDDLPYQPVDLKNVGVQKDRRA